MSVLFRAVTRDAPTARERRSVQIVLAVVVTAAAIWWALGQARTFSARCLPTDRDGDGCRNPSVLESGSNAPGDRNPAQLLQDGWARALSDWFVPLTGPALGVVSILVVLLVVSRLLVFLPGAPWGVVRPWWRRLMTVAGCVLLAVGAIGVVVDVTVLGTTEAGTIEAGQHFVIGVIRSVIVGLLGSFLLAVAISSRLRMTISCELASDQQIDGDGVSNQAGGGAEQSDGRFEASDGSAMPSGSHGAAVRRLVVSTAIVELARGRPGDVEVPAPGADTPTLITAVLDDQQTENKLLRSLRSAVVAMLGSSPWDVTVVTSGDMPFTILSIRRNGRLLVSSEIDVRPWTGIGLDDAETLRLRVAAAVVVATLARHHFEFRGLEGATEATSIVGHFLATTDLKDDPDRAIALLTRAVNADPGNLRAEVALQNLLHRRSSSADDVARYRTWLAERCARPDPDGGAEAGRRHLLALSSPSSLDRFALWADRRTMSRSEIDLRCQLGLSLIATLRNLSAIDERRGDLSFGTMRNEDGELFGGTLRSLAHLLAGRSNATPSLRARIRPLAGVHYGFAKASAAAEAAKARAEEMAKAKGKVVASAKAPAVAALMVLSRAENRRLTRWEESAAVSPLASVAYSLGCSAARRRDWPAAVGHLRSAFRSDRLFDWAAADPELTGLRTRSEWRGLIRDFADASDWQKARPFSRWNRPEEVRRPWTLTADQEPPAPAPADDRPLWNQICALGTLVRRAEQTTDPAVAHKFRAVIVEAMYDYGIGSLDELVEMRGGFALKLRDLAASLSSTSGPAPDSASISRWIEGVIVAPRAPGAE